MTIKEVKSNLEKMIGERFDELSELCNSIYEGFGEYEFEGEDHIIVDCSTSGTVEAYADHVDAPIVYISYEADIDEDGCISEVTVTDVELC